MSAHSQPFQSRRLLKRILCAGACSATLAITLDLVHAESSSPGLVTIHKRLREEMANGTHVVREKTEQWNPNQTAIIVCDMWDAHHCLNAVRRAEEMAPHMNQVLENARNRGVLIVHAPSSCMEPYKDHPARRRVQGVPSATNLPKDIGEWCRKIPAEEKGKYPIDQSDGGEDDDPVEHEQWHQRLAGMGRDPKSPWKAQINLLKIHNEDAISDSGVEVWNLLEHRGIKNVILMGVHINMCVLGRPFGLRQMAKNGKNVVLMRDMTDTMYNPERWPYVTHFVGTELIVEHIEKFVCQTITSVDFLGGEPFRFKNDRRMILIVIGEDEYGTEQTLPAFARKELEPRGFQVQVVHADLADKNNFPGLAQAVARSDLVLISVRRRTPPNEQLDAIRAHLAASKPLVGIRTASHAFAVRDQNAPLANGAATWPEFDPEVLGGHYTGHHGVGPKVATAVAPGAEKHPILRRVDLTRLLSNGSLYRVTPLAGSTTPIVIGSISGQDPQPLAWTNSTRIGQSRVFYTSLGHPDDFQNPAFQKLLLNGICWALDIAAPGSPPEQTITKGAAPRRVLSNR
jgi:nicotinamidase-related amidase/type 1 glutamine amidotransferase